MRLRLRAAALNHLDLFVVSGIPGIEMPMPHVMGADGAGVVEALGSGVRGIEVGDEVILNPGLWCGRCEFCMAGEQSTCLTYRLLGEHVDGTFAEAVVVPAINCHPRPMALSWSESAALPLATLTAWRMLITRARLAPGQIVLIHGIGGGVSLAALQIAVRAGATVFVSSHSDAKLERAVELGAVEAWNYERQKIGTLVRAVTARRGVDVVVDNVGTATFATSIGACRKGGVIVTCGGTTGPDLPVDVRRLFWGHLTVMGSTMGNEADFRAVVATAASGGLRPVVDRVFPLDETAKALSYLRSASQFGKVVIDIDLPA